MSAKDPRDALHSLLSAPHFRLVQSSHLQPQPQLPPADLRPDARFARLSSLCLGLAFYLALFGLCSGAIASADTWWHLATGRWIVNHHAVPHADPFSFATAGKPWVAHEYLTDILMFFLHRAGGFIALAAVNALLLTLAFAIAARAARAPRWLAYAAALFAAWAARPAFALRPQSISLAFGSAFLWIIRESLQRHQPKWLFALPCLMLLWVQLHAGYLLGIAFIGLLLLAEVLDWVAKRGHTQPREWWPLLAAGVACVAVVPINPNGFTMLTFPFFVMRMKINQTIQEWRPPNLHDPHLYPFVALAILTLLALVSSRERYRPGHFLVYAMLLAAAFKSARNIPVFCLVACILLAEQLRLPDLDRFRERAPVPWRTVAAVLVLAVAGYFCAQSAASGLAFQALAEKNIYPRDAVSYLAVHPLPPNLLNDYTFGGYLIWRLYPQYPVYVDGRADLYGDDFLAEYVEIYNAERDPRPFLDRNGINTVILAPSAGLSTLLRMMIVQGSWKVEYEDAHAVVFVRISALKRTAPSREATAH